MTALFYFLGVALTALLLEFTPWPRRQFVRTAVTVGWPIAAALLLGLMFIDCFRDYGRGE